MRYNYSCDVKFVKCSDYIDTPHIEQAEWVAVHTSLVVVRDSGERTHNGVNLASARGSHTHNMVARQQIVINLRQMQGDKVAIVLDQLVLSML